MSTVDQFTVPEPLMETPDFLVGLDDSNALDATRARLIASLEDNDFAIMAPSATSSISNGLRQANAPVTLIDYRVADGRRGFTVAFRGTGNHSRAIANVLGQHDVVYGSARPSSFNVMAQN